MRAAYLPHKQMFGSPKSTTTKTKRIAETSSEKRKFEQFAVLMPECSAVRMLCCENHGHEKMLSLVVCLQYLLNKGPWIFNMVMFTCLLSSRLGNITIGDAKGQVMFCLACLDVTCDLFAFIPPKDEESYRQSFYISFYA